MLQNTCVYVYGFFLFFIFYCGVDSPSLGFTVHFSFTLYQFQLHASLFVGISYLLLGTRLSLSVV